MFTPTDTSTMLGVVHKIGKFQAYFLEKYFRTEFTSGDKKIHFDEISDDVITAPFVSPVVAGKVHKDRGGKLKSFQPAYLKPKHVVEPGKTLQRRPGEQYLGTMTPAQRKEAVKTDLLMKQDKSITYREEWMAAQAVLYGKVTVKGEDYPEQLVDFERSADNNRVLVGPAKWDTVDPLTYDPTNDLTNWAENATGEINSIDMGKGAWTKFS
jgi:hypothetical protein